MENTDGGWAKGIPKNLLVPVRTSLTPTKVPLSSVTVGALRREA